MGVAAAGIAEENTGHHHLLVDAAPSSFERPIANHVNHLHFGAGQAPDRMANSVER